MRFKKGDEIICIMKNLTGHTYGKTYCIEDISYRRKRYHMSGKKHYTVINDDGIPTHRVLKNIKKAFVSKYSVRMGNLNKL